MDFVGRIKDTGVIFDLTMEDVAKQEGVYNPSINYGPVPVIVGEGNVIRGVDEKLEGAEVGKKITFDVPPEKAFGKRDPRLIKIYSMAEFKKQGITPKVGQTISFEDGSSARVLSVSGGRVRLDFNHPLAGKDVHYKMIVRKIIKDPKEKIEALLTIIFGNISSAFKVSYDKNKSSANIEYPEGLEGMLDNLKAEIKGKIKEVKDITFKKISKK